MRLGEDLRVVATRSAHRVMGHRWRRFVVRLRSCPWRLALVVDTSLSEPERREIAREFLDAALCCLDEGFSQKLRLFFLAVDDFFYPPVQRWLTAIFRLALSSTTHVENQFAHFRKFLGKCWRPCALSLLSAHHVALEASRIHGRGRIQEAKQRWG